MPTPIPTDALGISHVPVSSAPRIISLTPSITELLFALGLADCVVGRTDYCIHPQPAITAVPSVGGTKKVNHGRLQSLQPTHVIVNIDENPRELAERLHSYGLEVIVTHPVVPEDNIALYLLLGDIFQCQTTAEQLVQAFTEKLAQLRQQVWQQRQVLYLIWRKPWMSINRATYISAMLRLVGWQTVPAISEVRYPVVELDRTLLNAADLVLFSTEPYRFQQADLEAFAHEHACSLTKLRLIDGEMTSWYGNRAIAGLNYLEQFARGMEASLAG